MEIVRKIYPIFLVFVLLVLPSCLGQVQPDSSRIPTFTQTLTAKIIPSQTPSPIPSYTGTATKSATPTTQLRRITSTPTISLTVLPSLETTQVFEGLQKIRDQGMDCQSPCFIGIIPEETNFDQAVGIFNWLNNPLTSWGESYPNMYTSTLYYKDIGLTVEMMKEHDYVKNIRLRISLDIVYRGGITYPQIPVWPAFSLDALIKKYGPPTKVEILPSNGEDPSAPGMPDYSMYLYFEPLGLTIAYEDGVTAKPRMSKVCPLTDPYSGFEVWFGKDPAYLPGPGIPLEKATHLTLSQFSELMTQKTGPACFVINSKAFN
jgi:hypothetical protein